MFKIFNLYSESIHIFRRSAFIQTFLQRLHVVNAQANGHANVQSRLVNGNGLVNGNTGAHFSAIAGIKLISQQFPFSYQSTSMDYA